MKILFCIYKLDFADHISLAYLSAIAKRRGCSTHLCILTEGSLSEKVKELKPDVVAYSTNIEGFDVMLAEHKKALKIQKFHSIMGGPHVTIFPELVDQMEVDCICIGEGEGAFDDYLECIENNTSFDNIHNLATAGQRNPLRPLIADLDDIPFPDRDLVLANSRLKNTPKKTFYATRGCPYNCTYCCNSYYRKIYQGLGKYVRRFSVERVIQEIEHVKSMYRTDFIKFGDDLFAPKVDSWLEEFVKQYKKRVNIPFNCFLRFDTVTPDLLKLLKEANCFSAHLSVDSTSEKVREEVLGRRMKNVDIVKQLRMFHDHGINTWVNYMLAAPESTLEDDLATIDMSRNGKATYSHYSTTVPLKGTKLYDYCLGKNLIDVNTHKNDMSACMGQSELLCFTKKEAKIRYNVRLIGDIAAKTPRPFNAILKAMIKYSPPNAMFEYIFKSNYKYNIENRIFKL